MKGEVYFVLHNVDYFVPSAFDVGDECWDPVELNIGLMGIEPMLPTLALASILLGTLSSCLDC